MDTIINYSTASGINDSPLSPSFLFVFFVGKRPCYGHTKSRRRTLNDTLVATGTERVEEAPSDQLFSVEGIFLLRNCVDQDKEDQEQGDWSEE